MQLFNDSGGDFKREHNATIAPLGCECNRVCEPHISKARQLLGLLNFCLLSRAESEMERIDLLSAGGALPWAGPLARWLAGSALSLLLTPPPTTFLTHLSLCVAAASPPADTCPAVTGRDVRRAAEARIDLPPFPHKLHIKGGGASSSSSS